MKGAFAVFPFDNTYARLPERFYARVAAATVAEPRLVALNRPLAEFLGLDVEFLASSAGVGVLSGNVAPEGAEPLSMAYAGHQFGAFVPRLGDGRAILLGEVVGSDGKRRDIQLKGAGRTPFSRGGDGRAAVGPVLREYAVSEAMAALGVPTTRALAAVTTGETVLREVALPGAVLTRVAASHIRVGTFQFFAAQRDEEALRLLAAHALARHFPDAAGAGNDALSLLGRVIDAQADLVAKWLGIGFVHGVMNTDNTAVSGETIDYGPCAFLDEYDPAKTFSSIDRGGRYAFSNQPRIALWNVTRLAETLLPLISRDEDEAARLATARLDGFVGRFEQSHLRVMRAKLGLQEEREGDGLLVENLLDLLAAHRVDYTVFFRRLCDAVDDAADAGVTALIESDDGRFATWSRTWRERLGAEPRPAEERASAMRRVNPAFIPRNHRIEEAIEAAVRRADYQPFETLLSVLARPYDEQPDHAGLAEPPRLEERVLRTFCGT